MPARQFHRHRTARSALFILPPPREALRVRDIDRFFDLAAAARAFLKRGQGIIDPGNIYLRAINYVG